mgnify:CR=1 FL=1
MSQENDAIYDYYKQVKLTTTELKEFKQFENCSEKELKNISDEIFDLAMVAQKIIQENYD